MSQKKRIVNESKKAHRQLEEGRVMEEEEEEELPHLIGVESYDRTTGAPFLLCAICAPKPCFVLFCFRGGLSGGRVGRVYGSEGVMHRGVKYNVGDYVLVAHEERGEDGKLLAPHIARVERVWRDSSSGDVLFEPKWFARNTHLINAGVDGQGADAIVEDLCNSQFIYLWEGDVEPNPVEAIRGKCQVRYVASFGGDAELDAFLAAGVQDHFVYKHGFCEGAC